jgi:S1-C subfamily serine protease
MAAGRLRVRAVAALLALFRGRRVLPRRAGAGALLLAGVTGAGSPEEAPRSRAQIALSFAPVGREAAPAVANIYARKGRAADPFLSDPFFRFFFEGFRGGPLPRSMPANSLGSGVIVAADGLIVTNHHVIENADEIMVVLSDRREFRAELIGADQAADLALLDIEAEVIGR